MRRRDFVGLLGGLAVTSSLADLCETHGFEMGKAKVATASLLEYWIHKAERAHLVPVRGYAR